MLAGVLLLLLALAQDEPQAPDPNPPPRKDSITVEEKLASPADSAGSPAPVTAEQAKAMPSRPSNVRDALPLIPGVVRTPQGKLVISNGPEERSSLLVNSTDVTDPATGGFGATIPIDVVDSMNVYQSPFLAEYGRFTAGVVEVETKRGGDKWHGEFNDPTPELRIRSGHLVGVRAFTPRLSGSGPLIKGKLYGSGAFEYRLNKVPVFTLQFPDNETKTELWNAFAQFDWIASPKHLVTTTLHGVPQKIDYVNLGFYSPQPTTPGWHAHEYHGTITDHATVAGGTLESSFSFSRSGAQTNGQGERDFVLLPNVNDGNYFFRSNREADRMQWREVYSASPRSYLGMHHWKFGLAGTRTTLDGSFRAHPVEIRDLAGVLQQRIDFTGPPSFTLKDWEAGGFVQDSWNLTPLLIADLGVRADYQKITGVHRFAPRAGIAWSPFGDSATTFRAGYGWFFDRVPLNAFAWPFYPARTVYQGGTAVAYRNLLGVSDYSNNALVFGSTRPGNFAPESINWSLQLDQRLFSNVVLVRARYVQSRAQALMVVRPVNDAYVLGGSGLARSRQFEIMTRVAWKPERQLFFSYVHSQAKAHLNDFSEYLGEYPSPLIRPDYFAEPPGNIPHRFLAWGVMPFDHGIQVAPVFEWRTGFPYSALDAGQNYAGVPNTLRYPDFFSLDLRVSKDIAYRKHAFRVSLSAFNLTNHWNPEAVRWNIADPQFGETLGQRPRRFRVDFDFLF